MIKVKEPEIIERDLESLASSPQEKALKMQFDAQKVIVPNVLCCDYKQYRNLNFSYSTKPE